MREIKVVGLDAERKNVGIVEARLVFTDRARLVVDNLTLVQTEKSKSKQVRVSSDDVRRAQEIAEALRRPLLDASFFFSEIPTGAQSARAAKLLGMATGIIACSNVYLDRPLIEVSPTEVKLASVGKKTASKDEMVEWAVAKYPDLNWLRYERNGKTYKAGDLMLDNEHLADGIAIIHAGVRTAAFKQALAMLNGLRAVA